MIIATTNDIPGSEIVEVYGEVFGLTVRPATSARSSGPASSRIFGGELRGMTKALEQSRVQVIERMVEQAAKGANAIVGMRFDTSEMGTNWTEISAYGTAVRIRRA